MRDDIKINDRALALENQIIEKLEKVYDTDVELDVYNLGLIYEIDLDENGLCTIVMTFTDTACDCAESLPIEIVAGLKQIDGIEDVKVEVTWSPAWKITRISRYGRIALGLPPRQLFLLWKTQKKQAIFGLLFELIFYQIVPYSRNL